MQSAYLNYQYTRSINKRFSDSMRSGMRSAVRKTTVDTSCAKQPETRHLDS